MWSRTGSKLGRGHVSWAVYYAYLPSLYVRTHHAGLNGSASGMKFGEYQQTQITDDTSNYQEESRKLSVKVKGE